MDNRRPENFTWAFCLFFWGFSSYSRIFYSYGDVTITGEGLQILTFARHSWPLFVCLSGIFRPTREFFTHSETSPMPVKGCNFDFCSALMAIEQLGFLSVPHLLWHVASVCNAHLRETDTHSCCTAFGSGAVTTIFYDLGLSRLGFEHPTFRLWGQRSNPLLYLRFSKNYVYLSDIDSTCRWQLGMETYENV